MNNWKQEIIDEIALYKSNLDALYAFDKEAFLKEYRLIRQNLEKRIEKGTKFAYKTVCEYAASADTYKKDNLKGQADALTIKQSLSEQKKYYKSLLKKEETDTIKIKELNATIKTLKAEITKLNEDINKGGFFNALFGVEGKKARIAELERTVAEHKKTISELKKQHLTKDEKEIYESEIKAKESALRKFKKGINSSKENAEDDERKIQGAMSWLSAELRHAYKEAVESLTALESYKEYCKLHSLVDLTKKNAYINEHYKKLLPLVHISSGGFFNAELPEKYSAPCRELFSKINGYFSGDVRETLTQLAHGVAINIKLLEDVEAISNDIIINIFGSKNNTNEKAKKATDVIDPQFYSAVALLQGLDKISASVLQKELKFSNAKANKMLDELESAGLIGEYNGAKPRVVHKSAIDSYLNNLNTDDTAKNTKNSKTVPQYILNNLGKWIETDEIEKGKAALELKNSEVGGVALKEEHLNTVLKILDTLDGELPEIAMELMGPLFSKNDTYHSMLLKFKDMYYATPEQVAIANDEYYAKKKLAQMEKNARLEREMYEHQAELDRQAENRRAELAAEAERERTAAINRRTNEMSRQSELDRIAADKRSQDEIKAKNAIAEKERKEREAAQKEAERHARYVCQRCIYSGKCARPYTPNCPTYRPR